MRPRSFRSIVGRCWLVSVWWLVEIAPSPNAAVSVRVRGRRGERFDGGKGNDGCRLRFIPSPVLSLIITCQLGDLREVAQDKA